MTDAHLEANRSARRRVRELAELSPAVRAEAIRRLGGAYDHDLPEPETAWKVTPNITITDEQPSGDDLIGGPHA